MGAKLRKFSMVDTDEVTETSCQLNDGSLEIFDRQSEFHVAALMGQTELLEKLCITLSEEERLLEVNRHTTKYGDTPLHLAAKQGHLSIIKLLLKYGALVDAEDWIQWTPLHCAVWAQKTEAVILLLTDFSANVDSLNSNLETPLRLALKANHQGLIKSLIQFGAQLEIKDSQGQTHLHWAAASGKINLVHYLVVNCGVNIEARDKYNRTPIQVAMDFQKYDVVWALLQLGSDLRAIDKNDLVIRAARMGHSGAIRKLVAEGVNIDLTDSGGQRTPLHWAIKEGETEVILTLLEHGASSTSLDKYQKTPLEWATLYKDKKAMMILSAWQNKVRNRKCTEEGKTS